MLHHLLDKTTRNLIDMRTHFRTSLKVKSLSAIKGPVQDTVNQIDAELLQRGISFKKEIIKLMPTT